MISCRSSLPSTLTVGPVVRCLYSVASASALPLYLAALFLNEGPSLSADTEWHFMQPLFLSSASAAPVSTFCACASAVHAPSTNPRIHICFFISRSLFFLLPADSTGA